MWNLWNCGMLFCYLRVCKTHTLANFFSICFRGVQSFSQNENRKQSGVFRAALASAGAHEKAPRRKVQTLLHPKCPQIVVRPAGNRRLHLGSLLKMQSGRLEQLTAADALSASESRNAPSPRLSRPRHRNMQSAPFRTRQSL